MVMPLSASSCMVGGMSKQNPPPHTASESIAPEITTRGQIIAGIAGAGGATLLGLVIIPGVENLFNISRSMAILLSGGIILALLVAHISGRIAEARVRQRQQSRNPIDH